MAPRPRQLVVVGVSHKTAPVEVRERLAVGDADLPAWLEEVRRTRPQGTAESAPEAMLVSTCNRVEVYLAGDDPGAAIGQARTFLAGRAPGVDGQLYDRTGEAAVRHLFRVCAGLDSMVLGEPQILGQVKDAYTAAHKAGSAGTILNAACQLAFAAAKRVRSETALGEAEVSVASAAASLAHKIFGTLDGRTVLVVGAGEIAELAARHLAGPKTRILVANRTRERAEELADKVRGEARPFEELASLLVEVDVVVSSTAAPLPIISRAIVQAAVRARRYRPLFLVDLGVPRDVEPGAAEMENVYVYDIDDLGQLVTQNLAARQGEAERAEAIIDEETRRFLLDRRVRDGTPVIAELRQWADQVARAEAERTLLNIGSHLTDAQRQSVEAMAKAIVNRLLHKPTAALRAAAAAESDAARRLSDATVALFGLPGDGGSGGTPPSGEEH